MLLAECLQQVFSERYKCVNRWPDLLCQTSTYFRISTYKAIWLLMINYPLLFVFQIAILAMQKSRLTTIPFMVSRELIQQNTSFAAHSLGEYASLASIAYILPIESLVDLVFYRGMSMQSAVERDELGRSDYGMVAVNPSRISKSLTDTYLRYLVDSIPPI